MTFTFEARTLLELGRELISTDEVALYELIKNAVDAKSPRVEIAVQLRLKSSDFKEVIGLFEEGGDYADTRKRATLLLERSLIDPTHADALALLSKLKMSDFDEFASELKGFYGSANFLEVRDTGEGMSLDDLKDVFLRIGTRSRREQNAAGAQNLGDKGIGRLSAMRLGDRLTVRTSKAGESHWNILDIDWSLFSHDSRQRVEEIEIEPRAGEKKTRPDESGTVMRISVLTADWDSVRFADLLQGRIARMIDPFVPGLASRLIIARHNDTRIQVPSIPTELLEAAHAVCHVDFRVEGGEPILEGTIDYRNKHRATSIDQRGADVFSIGQETQKRRAKRGHAAYRLVPVKTSAFAKLGPFSCDIFWFNRRVVAAVEGLTSKPTETKREISHWSGGPMLYRYGFRILPYGDPNNDWLGLDEEAFASSGFKLNRQQIIGRVLLKTPHSAMSEQTNREGLIQSEAADALIQIMRWIVQTEMRGFINQVDDVEHIERRAADEDTKTITSARVRVDRALADVREEFGTAGGAVDDLATSVGLLSDRSAALLKRMDNVLTEAAEEREKFVYLAGIGLMTEFIFHELERAVAHAIDVLGRGALRQATVDSLRDQLVTLHKRISAFDELTGERRQTKTSFDFANLIDDVLSNHSNEFARHDIRVSFVRPEKPLIVKAVRGMMIQVIENLVVNAAYWLKQQKRFERGFEPRIEVVLDAKAATLTVEDNGPGVSEERLERIFEPFVTSKPSGQGRGLGLYISRDLVEYHKWKLYMDNTIGSVRNGRSNKFVLDMG